MKDRKRFLLIFFVILLNMFLIVGFLVIRDAIYENQLRVEVDKLTKLDMTKDRYNTKIKSKGSYALIEKAIKEYLDDYAVNLQKALDIVNDEEFRNLLLLENYMTDGPEFEKSINYIDQKQEEFNKNMEVLIEKCDEEKIKEHIKKVVVDPYYISLYDELMLGDMLDKNFLNSKDILEKNKEKVNVIFNTSKELFNFLKIHATEWVVEDGEIKFKTQELIDQYNNYVTKVK